MDKELAVPATRIRHRRSSALLGALAIVAALLLAGCAGQRDPTTYTSSVKKDFEQQCRTQLLVDEHGVSVSIDDSADAQQAKAEKASTKAEISDAADYCRCALKAVLKKVSFGDFKKVNENLRQDGGAVPASFTKALKSCDVPSWAKG